MCAHKVGSGPVGDGQFNNVSCRRKRRHAPAGEENMPNVNINGRNMSVEAAPDTPLLWAIREQLQMTGTKFGCGAGLCGACTVHVNGEAVRSCQTSLSDVAGKKITTIEGLSAKGDHPLQKAWIAEQVPQCGYCQSGQIMQAALPGLLGQDQAFAAASNVDPSVWYSIAPDGIVTVTCGKADMGQHIASTMAQIIAEELGSSWKDMRVQLASNDPKFNDPVLGAQITGGSWSTMMNFDAMSRAGAAGRMALTEAAAAAMGVPAGELVVRESTITHPKSKKSMTFSNVLRSGKITHTFTPDELKAIKLKTPDQYTMIGVSV